MATSSILGGAPAPGKSRGRDADALGPSDSSDSGSDVQGERAMPTLPDNPGELGAVPIDTASDSDASGTGERASATGERMREAADILPDRTGGSGEDAPAGDIENLTDDEDETVSGNGDDDVEDAGDTPRDMASKPAPPPRHQEQDTRPAPLMTRLLPQLQRHVMSQLTDRDTRCKTHARLTPGHRFPSTA